LKDDLLIGWQDLQKLQVISKTFPRNISADKEAAKEEEVYPRYEDVFSVFGCDEENPTKPRPSNKRPTDEVFAFIHQCRKQTHLILIDRSGTPFVKRLGVGSASAVIKVMKKRFKEKGYPRKILSNGASQFRAQFNTYCQERNISHVKSYYSQGNGLVEDSLERCKTLLRDARDPSELRRSLKMFCDTFDHQSLPSLRGWI